MSLMPRVGMLCEQLDVWLGRLHWRRQLWGTGARAPLDLQQLNFFSPLRLVQSLAATICRQLPPVKTQ